MKNIAVIFAGGSGVRMQTVAKPKQFLELNMKPIIIYTIELFDNHPDIDGIIVVCIKDWITFLQKQLNKFEITKVIDIVPGGETGQNSIYNGLKSVESHFGQNCIVLIHDGVRPLITDKTISENINTVLLMGNCITCAKAIETFMVKQQDGSLVIPHRNDSLIARAPQSFFLKDVLTAHDNAIKDNCHTHIDTCTLMSYYGYHMNTIEGPIDNIKITTPADFFIFRALQQVRENQQIFGF